VNSVQRRAAVIRGIPARVVVKSDETAFNDVGCPRIDVPPDLGVCVAGVEEEELNRQGPSCGQLV
jgi:hypothetical protein